MPIPLISKVVPTGAFPTHEDVYGAGGCQARASVADMLSIPTPSRKVGMLVYVQDIGAWFQLLGGTADVNFVPASNLAARRVVDANTRVLYRCTEASGSILNYGPDTSTYDLVNQRNAYYQYDGPIDRYAVRFTGSGNAHSANGAVLVLPVLTLECWVKINVYQGGASALFGISNNSAGSGNDVALAIGMTDSNLRFQATVGSDGAGTLFTANTSYQLQLGIWYFLSLSYSGSTMVGAVNGNPPLVTSGLGAALDYNVAGGNANYFIGASTAAASNCPDMHIASAIVSDVVRTQDYLNEQYLRGLSLFP